MFCTSNISFLHEIGLGALIGEWKTNGQKQKTIKGVSGGSVDSASKAVKRHTANKPASFLFKNSKIKRKGLKIENTPIGKKAGCAFIWM